MSVLFRLHISRVVLSRWVVNVYVERPTHEDNAAATVNTGFGPDSVALRLPPPVTWALLPRVAPLWHYINTLSCSPHAVADTLHALQAPPSAPLRLRPRLTDPPEPPARSINYGLGSRGFGPCQTTTSGVSSDPAAAAAAVSAPGTVRVSGWRAKAQLSSHARGVANSTTYLCTAGSSMDSIACSFLAAHLPARRPQHSRAAAGGGRLGGGGRRRCDTRGAARAR